jgi:HAD superfamily hydrolase (TIGR01509 family)
MTNTVTFDFHNTLIECDPWFDLEVRTLASAYLDWDWATTCTTPPESLRREADRRYRALRQRVIDSGDERDAIESVASVLRALDIEADPDRLEDGVAHLMRSCLPSARLVPGADDLVRSLHASGIRLAVVSSAAYHPFLLWTLSMYRILDCFEAVVSSAECGIYKTNPAIYRHALRLLGADPCDAAHIGDSQRFDVSSARAVGMRTVWFDRGDEPAVEPLADHVVQSLADVTPDILGIRRTPR